MREGWKGEQLLGELKTFIVGMQYYEAEVNPGEVVNLEREPDNPHDANSIRVENPDFLPVGHIPRRISGWLAPLLDVTRARSNLANTEASIPLLATQLEIALNRLAILLGQPPWSS